MRLASGGDAIDRSVRIAFDHDGRTYEGFAGDTLASALLANDVAAVAPSPLLGRPRGVTSAGVEENAAFVEVCEPWFDPIVPATVVPLVEGLVTRGRPGFGRFDASRAGFRSRHRAIHVETVVIGGGLSGLRAAVAARSEEHTSELQSRLHLVCRLLL